MKYIFIHILVLFSFFLAGCGSDNTQETTNSTALSAVFTENTLATSKPPKSINLYGTLPKQQNTQIEIIFDLNNNGVIDENESIQKKVYTGLNTGYVLNNLETKLASKMWVSYSALGFAPQTKVISLNTDKYQVNIDAYLKQEKIEVKVQKDVNKNYLLFLIAVTDDDSLSVSSLYSPTKTIDNPNIDLQLSIALDKLSSGVSSVNAYFHASVDSSIFKPYNVDNKQILLDISRSISYTLFDQNNDPIILKTDALTYQFNTPTESKKLFLYKNQNIQTASASGTLNTTSTGQFLLAKTVASSTVQNICVNMQDAQANVLSSVLVEAHAPLDISSKYTDENGQATLQIHQDFDQYQFDFTIYAQGIYNRSFTPTPSSENNCSYGITLTAENTSNKSLDIHVIEENNISLEGEYIYAHNSDYSFYTYGYLNADNTISMSTPINQALTVVIGTEQYSVSESEITKVLYYTKKNPFLISLSFEKENPSDDFPKLFVRDYLKSITNITPTVTQTLKTDAMQTNLKLERAEVTDAYQLWVYNIDKTMPGENEFNVQNDNTILKTIDYSVEDYPTEINSIAFKDSRGKIYLPTDMLYTSLLYEIMYNIDDKNNNIVSFSNNLSSESKFPLTSADTSIRVMVDLEHNPTIVSKTFSLNTVEDIPILNKDFNLENQYIQGSTIFLSVEAIDKSGYLTYSWYANDILVGSTNTLAYTFQTKEPYTIKCVITNEAGISIETAKDTNILNSVYIVDISEIQNKTLMGNYTFTVKAADALGTDLNYSWVVNGVEKSTSPTLDISFLQDGEIINIKCLVSNINGNASYEKSTEIYYPEPIILSGLQNLSMAQGDSKKLYVQAINTNEINNDSLQYKWYVDNVLMQSALIEGEWYTYTQTDDTEHTLKCEVSNSYKSISTQARVGNISATSTVIKSLEGNQIKIYDEDVITVYDVNSSGQVEHAGTASNINVSSQFTKETVLTPLLFSRLLLHPVVNTKILVDERRIAVNNFSSYSRVLENNYPNLYRNRTDITTMMQNADTNQDQYVDVDEIYIAGVSIYDINGDNKIQMKELRTYDDTNVTLNFAIFRKDISETLVNLNESAFEDAFNRLPDKPYYSDIRYPDDEYITAEIFIYNSLLSLPQSESESLIISPSHQIENVNRDYNSTTQTYSGTYQLRMHHPDVSDQNISFVLINFSTQESYFVHDANFSSPIIIDYALFSPNETFDVPDATKGAPLVIRDNNLYQAGDIVYDDYSYLSRFFAYYDAVLAQQFGVYFNVTNTLSITDQSKTIDTLDYYTKVFNPVENSNPLLSQYLALDIQQNSPEIYDIVNNSVDIDDVVQIDKIKHIYHDSVSGYTPLENIFTYIQVEELPRFNIDTVDPSLPTPPLATSTLQITSLDDANCISYFGGEFCGVGNEWSHQWNTNKKLKVIDYANTGQNGERTKTWTYDEAPVYIK